MRTRASLLALAFALPLAGCGEAPTHAGRPSVAVSVPPLAYLVDQLSGGAVDTVVMLPPGASPTQYQPSVDQLQAVSRAVLYVKVGHPAFPFETAWLDRLLEGAPGIRVVGGPPGTAARLGADPHLWLAPRWMAGTAEAVASALAEILPEHRDGFRDRQAAFARDAAALEREIAERLAPFARRPFLVQHPAWGHFAAAFDLEQVAVEHHHREPDPHALAERIAWAGDAGIRTVFVQPQLDPAPAETVARAIGARVVPLDPLAYDWAANLRHAAQVLSEDFAE